MKRKPINEMTREELAFEYSELLAEYEQVKAERLSLDMSRGKPCREQLDLSDGILTVLKTGEDCRNNFGTDMRNYGMPIGVPAARKLFAELCGVEFDNVFLGGNASLELMYDAVARAELFGVAPGSTPWCKLDKVKFLCPSPGYDRHFRICETFGIEMITVEMRADGPDMDTVERLVAEDESIKGIWCVPKHSNPTGAIYSDETVRRFAALKPAAKDFRVFWDNAYMVHDLYDDVPDILNIFDLTAGTENEDMVYMFTSTSKITYAGSGISAFITSDRNMKHALGYIGTQIISYDKLNQFRHAIFFEDADGIRAHMKKHAEILRPRFEAVLAAFEKELCGRNIAAWTKPTGGYFISLDMLIGSAKRVYELCLEAGMKLTEAGATFPYGNDPHDSNLRIAPSYPPLSELKQAAQVLCLCVKLAAVEKALHNALSAL
ncbi:MAG: aminotransferase class I/II-fold pyridoxal phosphate-dependent enzyme [Clostridia bacterium]|nr:aminotransferase class I/II-fold pyridoxal phosphate-dependent enzyme [Clostridia bacterium]